MGFSIKVADEVWIGCALLHFENPIREDFSISEIVDRVAKENIYGKLRTGVLWHVNLHCIANKRPNPARYRMLYETRQGRRRLWRPGDDFHPDRADGKSLPRQEDIPVRYTFLLDWYEEWRKRAEISGKRATKAEMKEITDIKQIPVLVKGSSLVNDSPQEFEIMARKIMSEFFDTRLEPGMSGNIPKRFDLVSSDGKIVGDAKYYTLVRGQSIPQAKFAAIAEYVWLLEKTEAEEKFLVFGNDRRVPEEWLERYGHLVRGIQFFFLDKTGVLIKLK